VGLLGAIIFFVAIAATAWAGDADDVTIHWEGQFDENISAYNLFRDPIAQIPNDGLVPYDVITPLFTDYAEKHRFVYVPEGETIHYHPRDAFTFPVGAALVKTFSYPVDFRDPSEGRRLIETRLMVHAEDGWKGAAYVWNDAQTNAVLKVAGARVPVEWTHHDGARRSTTYLVPNMNQCKVCHRDTDDTVSPIGIKARHVNRDYEYQGRTANQLDEWTKRDILDGAPTHAPRHAAWDDPQAGSIGERVLGYFDINCAHCHNPRGLASGTKLDLTYEQCEPLMRGVMKRPTAAGNASRGRYFAIVPGDPDASFLLHRLESTEPNIRMPEVGRTIVHEEGAALIREWIAGINK